MHLSLDRQSQQQTSSCRSPRSRFGWDSPARSKNSFKIRLLPSRLDRIIMARKSAKTPASKPTETTLALCDLRIGLDFLERENHQLIGKIEKKRTELTNLGDRIREIATEISQRSAPIFQQLLELDLKLHAIFAEIFATKKLGKQTRKNIERVYGNLQAAGLISPCRDLTERFDDTASTGQPDWEWSERQDRSSFEADVPKLDRSQLQKIRQIFLRLAAVFHPDRAVDPELQKYHTAVMQEINQAYQSGDLAKLLAIEQKHQLGAVIDRDDRDDLRRRYEQIAREHEFLKSQFEQLKLELRMTKNTQPGAMVAEYHQLSKAGYDPIGEMVAQTESQVTTIAEVYRFVLDFRDRRITIKDFMKGPPSFQQISEEELFIEFFDL